MKQSRLVVLRGSLQADFIPSSSFCSCLDDDKNQGYLVLYLEKKDARLLTSTTGKKTTRLRYLWTLPNAWRGVLGSLLYIKIPSCNAIVVKWRCAKFLLRTKKWHVLFTQCWFLLYFSVCIRNEQFSPRESTRGAFCQVPMPNMSLVIQISTVNLCLTKTKLRFFLTLQDLKRKHYN